MERFASYAFNKSHAVAYSLHTVRTAWLAKYYYPEYMTAVLNANIKKADKIRGYISVCKQHGLAVLPPSINKSEANFSTDGKDIRFGLGGLRNVGSAAKGIIDERNSSGLYTSYTDFLYRMGSNQRLDKRILVSLIEAGCLDEFDRSSRNAKLLAVEETASLVSSCKKLSATKHSLVEMLEEAGRKNPANLINMDYDKTVPEMDKRTLLAKEDEVMGFYLSGHPMDEFDDMIGKSLNVYYIFDIVKQFDVSEDDSGDDESVKDIVLRNTLIAGIIKEITKKYDKNGNPWWTFSVEDKTGIIKATYFNGKRANPVDLNEVMVKGSLVELQGTVSDEGYGAEMKVEFLAPLSKFMNVAQAKEITLVARDGDTYSVTEYGRTKEYSVKEYIRKVLDERHPANPYGVATVKLSERTADDIQLRNDVLGSYSLNLEQYVKLQRALGAANVIPMFQQKTPE